MPRPSINFVGEMSPQAKRRLVEQLGPLTGFYECSIAPRRNLKSTQQTRYFHAVIVEMFYQFLRDQDYADASREMAKGIIKEKFLRVEIVNPATGEVVGSRVKGWSELTIEEAIDLIDRSRIWLADFFGLVIPDPDPSYWQERSGPTQTKAIA